MSSSALFCQRKILQRRPNTSQMMNCQHISGNPQWSPPNWLPGFWKQILLGSQDWGRPSRFAHLGHQSFQPMTHNSPRWSYKNLATRWSKMDPYQWKDVKAGVEVRYAPLSNLACHLNGGKKTYKILSAQLEHCIQHVGQAKIMTYGPRGSQ